MFRANFSLLSLLLGAFIFSSRAYGQEQLRTEIEQIAKDIKGSMGAAIKHLEKGDTLSVHGDRRFPMQSVYKFHLALAVLAQVDQGKLAIDKKILIEKKDLHPNTWSPIAKKYPEGNVELTIKELLTYTVSQSDNNGCDILFRLVGGPLKVQSYIHGLGIKDVAILNTEEEMHTEWDMQFRNWTTPKAMTDLLEIVYKKKVLSPASLTVLVQILEQTITGNKRIKGLLPKETVVGHKTGMGGTDDGYLGAINDVGVITLPNGDHLAIAFFISKTREDVEALESAMAKISKLVFDYYANSKH